MPCQEDCKIGKSSENHATSNKYISWLFFDLKVRLMLEVRLVRRSNVDRNMVRVASLLSSSMGARK